MLLIDVKLSEYNYYKWYFGLLYEVRKEIVK